MAIFITFVAVAVAVSLAVAALLDASRLRQALWERDERLNRVESRLRALERARAAGGDREAPAEQADAAEPIPAAVAPVPRAAAQRAALHRVAGVMDDATRSGDAAPAGGPAPNLPTPPTPPTPPKTAAEAEPSPLPVGVNIRTNVHPDAAPRATWEEKLGARLFVWVGGVALLLAGAFLVKYSFDSGMLSPGVRLSLSAVFGVVLLGAGEWLRRRSARVAEAVTAAGVADLFAVVLAATRLYEYLPPWVGFAMMAVLTAAAVALSLRHGQFVALLGLLGGFITPALISDGPGAPGPLFTYLLLLETGLLIVTGRRGWFGLATLTLVGSLAWAAIYGVFIGGAAAQAWAAPFLVASAAAYVAGAARLTSPDGPRTRPFVLAVAAVVASAALLGLLAAYGSFSFIEMGLLGLLGAGAIVLARVDPRYLPMPAVTAGISLITLLAWSLRGVFGSEALDVGTLGWLTVAFGALYAAGGYVCQWRSGRRGAWGVLVVVAGHAYFLAGIGIAGAELPSWMPWWAIGLALAGLCIAMAMPVSRRGEAGAEGDGGERLWSALMLGAAGFLTWSAGGLDHPWVAVAWSVLAAAAAWGGVALRLPAMRWAVAWLAATAVAMLVLPGPFSTDLGQRILFNPLLPQYGVPMLAFAAAGLGLWRLGEAPFARALAALAAASGLALVTLLIRHGFHRDDLAAMTVTAYEWATYAAAWGGIGLVTLLAARGRLSRIAPVGVTLAGVGVALALVGCGLLENPLWTDVAVGRLPVLNGLGYLFGLPATVAAAAAIVLRRRGEASAARAFTAAAVVLLFALVSLQVRQAFVGSVLDLDAAGVTSAEHYTYSASWIVLGLALLAVGVWRRSLVLRYASLAVMLLAVGKVFVLDAAQLRDLWRVLSFLGLGVSLLVLGYVYQRFVFSRPAGAAAERVRT